MKNKIRIHHKELLMVTGVFLFLFCTCVKKPMEKSSMGSREIPVSKENFITDPFGYKPTINNLSNRLFPDYKLQIYSLKNIHNPQQSDTIYRFYRKKSELFVYKTIYGRELFFAANITDNKVVLKNGVKVGISRADFFKNFTNLKPTQEDSVRLGTKRATILFNFVFKGDRLKAIKINNYID